MKIKYKGKRIDTGEFVYGCPIIHSDGTGAIFVSEDDSTLFVEADSIRRFINAHDKNGAELYIGDIINDFGGGTHVTDKDSPEYHPTQAFPPTKVIGDRTRLGEIVEEDGTVRIKTRLPYSYNLSNASKLSEMEKVGDNYNNPELIEKYEKYKRE